MIWELVWRYRLTVRTEPSQGLNTGSIPVSATTLSVTYSHIWPEVDAHYREMQGRGLPVESPRDAPWGERFFRAISYADLTMPRLSRNKSLVSGMLSHDDGYHRWLSLRITTSAGARHHHGGVNRRHNRLQSAFFQHALYQLIGWIFYSREGNMKPYREVIDSIVTDYCYCRLRNSSQSWQDM